MKKRKLFTIPTSKVIVVMCDVCGKEFDVESDWEEIGEFLHIDFTGGYGSIFGDGNQIESDICQHCLKKKFGEFLRITENINHGS